MAPPRAPQHRFLTGELVSGNGGLLYLTSALQIPVVCRLVTSRVFGTCKLLLPKQPGMHHKQVATSLKMLRGWSADNEISITLKKKTKQKNLVNLSQPNFKWTFWEEGSTFLGKKIT